MKTLMLSFVLLLSATSASWACDDDYSKRSLRLQKDNVDAQEDRNRLLQERNKMLDREIRDARQRREK